ncbi:hypothetical protein AB9G26_08635 [Francisella philomiragia]|uniref:hypothetical protein n=1 Tax=Francisella philomiragia TaxID=28110 RepID=UPI0035175196
MRKNVVNEILMLKIERVYSSEKIISAINVACDDYINYRRICNQKSDVLQVFNRGMIMSDANENALAENIKRELSHNQKGQVNRREKIKFILKIFAKKYPVIAESDARDNLKIEQGSLFAFIIYNIYYTACVYDLKTIERHYNECLSGVRPGECSFLSNASDLKDTSYMDPLFAFRVYASIYNYVHATTTFEESLQENKSNDADKIDINSNKLLGSSDQSKIIALMCSFINLIPGNTEKIKIYLNHALGLDEDQIKEYIDIFNYIASGRYSENDSKKNLIQLRNVVSFVNFNTSIALLQGGITEYQKKYERKANSNLLNTGVEGLSGVVVQSICDQLVTLAQSGINLGLSYSGLSIIAKHNVLKIMETGVVDGLSGTLVDNILGPVNLGSGYGYRSAHDGKSLAEVDYNAYLKQVELQNIQSFLKNAITTPIYAITSKATSIKSKGYGLKNRHGVTGQRRAFLFDIYFRNIGTAVSNIFDVLAYGRKDDNKFNFAERVIQKEYENLLTTLDTLPNREETNIGSLYFCFKLHYPWQIGGNPMDFDVKSKDFKGRVSNWRKSKFGIA